jgi:hypothetical protein
VVVIWPKFLEERSGTALSREPPLLLGLLKLGVVESVEELGAELDRVRSASRVVLKKEISPLNGWGREGYRYRGRRSQGRRWFRRLQSCCTERRGVVSDRTPFWCIMVL